MRMSVFISIFSASRTNNRKQVHTARKAGTAADPTSEDVSERRGSRLAKTRTSGRMSCTWKLHINNRKRSINFGSSRQMARAFFRSPCEVMPRFGLGQVFPERAPTTCLAKRRPLASFSELRTSVGASPGGNCWIWGPRKKQTNKQASKQTNKQLIY